MERILVVEDDAALAQMLAAHLRREGFEVRVAGDGATALNVVRQATPDAVLLDIGLPGLDGIEVCRWLRERDNWTPLVFLTARDSEDERILGIEAGADDYVTKPFSPRELTARLRALLRRAAVGRAVPEADEELALGDVRVDLAEHRVFLGGEAVDLTPREYDLLVHLVRSPRRVHTREQLLAAVWNGSEAGQRTVDVHVAQLRAKGIGIRTVRGTGYAAEVP